MKIYNRTITIGDKEYPASIIDGGLNQSGITNKLPAIEKWLITNYGKPGKDVKSKWFLHDSRWICFTNEHDRLQFYLTWLET